MFLFIFCFLIHCNGAFTLTESDIGIDAKTATDKMAAAFNGISFSVQYAIL